MVLGLASTGLHSNGYSLVRKVVFEAAGLKVGDFVPELGRPSARNCSSRRGSTCKPIRHVLAHYPVKKKGVIRGLAHITGGGLPDNVPRMLPPGRRVHLQSAVVADAAGVRAGCSGLGNIAEAEMFRVFNMGIGFVMIASPSFAKSIVAQLANDGVAAWIIGEVRDGEPGVDIA